MEINLAAFDNLESNDSIIDHAYLDEITGGDTELKGELISMFESETVPQLSNISNASKAGQFDILKQAIHKYRSSLFSVGLLKTASKYKEIETVLKRNEKIDNLTSLLHELERESQIGLIALKEISL